MRIIVAVLLLILALCASLFAALPTPNGTFETGFVKYTNMNGATPITAATGKTKMDLNTNSNLGPRLFLYDGTSWQQLGRALTVTKDDVTLYKDTAKIQFTGSGVSTVTGSNGNVVVTISGGSSSSLVTQDEGTSKVGDTRIMNFIGAGVTAAKRGDTTADVTIPALTVKKDAQADLSGVLKAVFTGAGVSSIVDNGSGQVTINIPGVATSGSIAVLENGVTKMASGSAVDFRTSRENEITCPNPPGTLAYVPLGVDVIDSAGDVVRQYTRRLKLSNAGNITFCVQDVGNGTGQVTISATYADPGGGSLVVQRNGSNLVTNVSTINFLTSTLTNYDSYLASSVGGVPTIRLGCGAFYRSSSDSYDATYARVANHVFDDGYGATWQVSSSPGMYGAAIKINPQFYLCGSTSPYLKVGRYPESFSAGDRSVRPSYVQIGVASADGAIGINSKNNNPVLFFQTGGAGVQEDVFRVIGQKRVHGGLGEEDWVTQRELAKAFIPNDPDGSSKATIYLDAHVLPVDAAVSLGGGRGGARFSAVGAVTGLFNSVNSYSQYQTSDYTYSPDDPNVIGCDATTDAFTVTLKTKESAHSRMTGLIVTVAKVDSSGNAVTVRWPAFGGQSYSTLALETQGANATFSYFPVGSGEADGVWLKVAQN